MREKAKAIEVHYYSVLIKGFKGLMLATIVLLMSA